MNEARLRELLREAPVPAGGDAERRGLAVVEAAFAERSPARRPASLPRLVLALAVAALLAALVLSPAGAAVRGWVDEVFTATPRPEPGLAGIPAGGRLLVESPAGPWVVRPDGARRLLGAYDAASWSPHGLFVAVAAGRELSAVEPDGTPRWTISAPGRVADPRWSPSGYRIAYRSGRGPRGSLRVTAADGSGDRQIATAVAPVAPAWSPFAPGQLAFVGGGGDLVLVPGESWSGGDSRSEESAAHAGPALPGIESISWQGGMLLEAAPRALRVRLATTAKMSGATVIGPGRDIPIPARTEVLDAALAPRGDRIAALLLSRRAGAPRTTIAVFDLSRAGGPRRLLTVPGRLPELAWSPDGRRLLVAWPRFDQWLFLPVAAHRRGRAVAGIARAFAPGSSAPAFPTVAGWCCSAAG